MRLAFFGTYAYFNGMKLSALCLFSLSACLVVSCAEKKPELMPVKKVAEVAAQSNETESPEKKNDDHELANQLRDPSGMLSLEAANGDPGSSAPVSFAKAVEPVEIPRPTSPAPAPPLPKVNLPEIPQKE
jgi:hypothetical protein